MSDHAQAILVRPVRPGDAAQLRDSCFSANTLEQIKGHIAESIRAAKQGTQVLFLAEADGVTVGTGTLERRSHPLYAHRGEVVGLVVHPHYQRRGIARRIAAEEAGILVPRIQGQKRLIVFGRIDVT
jgi:ribosomal protein S18 acetylase RimI-like enzyme